MKTPFYTLLILSIATLVNASWLLSVTLWPSNPLSIGGGVSPLRWIVIPVIYLIGFLMLGHTLIKGRVSTEKPER